MRPVLIFSNAKSVRQSKHLLCLKFILLYPLFPFTNLKRFRFNKKTVVDQPSPSHRKESSSAVASLDSVNDRAGIYSKVATCGDLLRTADFHNVNHQDQLRESVLVSDDYITVRKRLERFILWPTGVFHQEPCASGASCCSLRGQASFGRSIFHGPNVCRI